MNKCNVDIKYIAWLVLTVFFVLILYVDTKNVDRLAVTKQTSPENSQSVNLKLKTTDCSIHCNEKDGGYTFYQNTVLPLFGLKSRRH